MIRVGTLSAMKRYALRAFAAGARNDYADTTKEYCETTKESYEENHRP